MPSSWHTPLPDSTWMISQLPVWVCRPMDEPTGSVSVRMRPMPSLTAVRTCASPAPPLKWGTTVGERELKSSVIGHLR